MLIGPNREHRIFLDATFYFSRKHVLEGRVAQFSGQEDFNHLIELNDLVFRNNVIEYIYKILFKFWKKNIILKISQGLGCLEKSVADSISPLNKA